MFSSNGPTINQRTSSSLINNIQSINNHDNNISLIGTDDDQLINLNLESLSLSPKSRSETRQGQRNVESSTELTNDYENQSNHLFTSSSNESNKFEGRKRRGSLFEDDQTVQEVRTSSSSSSRLFSMKTAVNRPRQLIESEENETIPFIPDIDELDDPNGKGSTDVPNNFLVNKLISLQELETDIINHQAFSNLCSTDSTILSSRLIAQPLVKEDDVPWTWDSLISEVSSYIEPNNE